MFFYFIFNLKNIYFQLNLSTIGGFVNTRHINSKVCHLHNLLEFIKVSSHLVKLRRNKIKIYYIYKVITPLLRSSLENVIFKQKGAVLIHQTLI